MNTTQLDFASRSSITMANEVTKITSSACFLLFFNISVGLLVTMQALHYFRNSGSLDNAWQIVPSKTPDNMELNTSLDVEKRGDYYVHHVPPSSERTLPILDSVTYVTHCSPHNLRYLPSLLERWNGPVSLAIITSSGDFQAAIRAINSLYVCYPAIALHVTFHVVIPEDHASSISIGNDQRSFEVPCNQLIKYLFENLKGRNFELKGLPYPGNILTNVARLHATTNFILVADIDLSPSLGLYEQTVKFFKEKVTHEDLKKTAFIVPTFEIEEINYVPMDKDDLAIAVDGGHARQFHKETCPHCHKISNYERWFKLKRSDGNLHVAYPVVYQKLCEPFTITHKSAPPYDERFKQYGFNRASYACQLYMDGFSFDVLDPVFLLHKGFKIKNKFHSNKERENQANAVLFKQFVQEQIEKYPRSGRKCL